MSHASNAYVDVGAKRFPVLMVPDTLPQIKERLLKEFPHVAEAVDVLLSDLTVGEPLVFEPTIFVGNPDFVVSDLLASIAKTFGVHIEEIDCEVTDCEDIDYDKLRNFLHGVAKHYIKARPSAYSAGVGVNGWANSFVSVRNLDAVVSTRSTQETDDLVTIASTPSEGWLDNFTYRSLDIRFVSTFLSANTNERPVPYEVMAAYRPIAINRTP